MKYWAPPGTSERQCAWRLAAFVLALSSITGVARADGLDEGSLGIEATIINQTQTPAGQEFFRLFANNWADSSFSRTYGVRVLERPSARFGGQILVYHQDLVLVKAFLPFNRDRIRTLADQASAYVAERVAQLQVNSLFGGDPDLAADEIR